MQEVTVDIQGIPCRVWAAEEPKGCIVMVHGLQSHSGWFCESAGGLANQGYSCIAFDRRGSGRSSQPRGHVDTYRQWFDELDSVVRYAEEQFPALPVHLLSLCFGAKVVLGSLGEIDGLAERVRSAILMCPGIGTKVDLGLASKLRMALGSKKRTDRRIPTPLRDDLFTDVRKYLDFIQSDPLALRAATPGFYFETAKLNRRLPGCASHFSVPALFMLAGQDRISDNYKTTRFFQRILSTDKRIVSYAQVKHSLLFSDERQRALADILNWLEGHP